MNRLRRVQTWAADVVTSRVFLGGAIGLLALSAVLGNVAQIIDRGHAQQDKTSLRHALADNKAELKETKSELANTKGEQECRAQLASDAELVAGQLNLASNDFAIAVWNGDRAAAGVAVLRMRDLAGQLKPLLEARQASVASCKEKAR